MSDPKHVWRLTDGKINDLQVKSVDDLIRRLGQAHYTNVQLQVRINGQFETYEADWLKHLRRAPFPDEARLALLEECATKLRDAAAVMDDGPDDSDEAMAQALFAKAVEAARALKRLASSAEGDL